MKCIVCSGTDVIPQKVQEELHYGNNIIIVPIEAQVCQLCGERYYSRAAIKYLEKIENEIKETNKGLREVGKVLLFE